MLSIWERDETKTGKRMILRTYPIAIPDSSCPWFFFPPSTVPLLTLFLRPDHLLSHKPILSPIVPVALVGWSVMPIPTRPPSTGTDILFLDTGAVHFRSIYNRIVNFLAIQGLRMGADIRWRSCFG